MTTRKTATSSSKPVGEEMGVKEAVFKQSTLCQARRHPASTRPPRCGWDRYVHQASAGCGGYGVLQPCQRDEVAGSGAARKLQGCAGHRDGCGPRRSKTAGLGRVRWLHRQPHDRSATASKWLPLDEAARPSRWTRPSRSSASPWARSAWATWQATTLAGLSAKRRAVEQPDMKYSKTADLLCEMGRFGQKIGAGWYDYQAGKRDAIPSDVVNKMIEEHRRR